MAIFFKKEIVYNIWHIERNGNAIVFRFSGIVQSDSGFGLSTQVYMLSGLTGIQRGTAYLWIMPFSNSALFLSGLPSMRKIY